MVNYYKFLQRNDTKQFDWLVFQQKFYFLSLSSSWVARLVMNRYFYFV